MNSPLEVTNYRLTRYQVDIIDYLSIEIYDAKKRDDQVTFNATKAALRTFIENTCGHELFAAIEPLLPDEDLLYPSDKIQQLIANAVMQSTSTPSENTQ